MLSVSENKEKDNQKKSSRIPQTSIGDTPISAKEDALECIMSAEANAGFEQMGRYMLNKAHVTRNGVDPTKLQFPPEDLADWLTDADFNHYSPHCQDMEPNLDLVKRCPVEAWKMSPVEWESGGAPEWAYDLQGLRLGFGMGPVPRKVGVQKDETPKGPEDRIFAARCEQYVLVGVVNGHGHPTHSVQLADFVAEMMPQAVFQSPALVDEGNQAASLTWAFHYVHCKASDTFSLELAGAACTVVLMNGEDVWVAHVGDCRAVLAVPDPMPNAEQFHFAPNTLTQDHKLSVKAEFDRALHAGAEMRKLVNDNVYRLFLQSEDVPGLTLTRSIGDRVGHMIGVTHTPGVCTFKRADMQAGNGSFLVIGSGGIWANMAEKRVVNWVSRCFADAGEAADSLCAEAAGRWEDPESRNKQSLRHGLPDCFGTVLVFFDPVDGGAEIDNQPHRQFVLGPHVDKDTHREWSEVWHGDRSAELRKIQARMLPTEELPP